MVAVAGPNFSGRTDVLRAAGLGGRLPVYIGPEISNYLSGLALSVEEELNWGRLSSSVIPAVVASFRLEKLLEMNPFAISGGEQALVAIASAWAAKPDKLAIDCAFEQLSIQNRIRVIDFLTDSDDHRQKVLFVDNRFDEYADRVPTIGHMSMSPESNCRPLFGHSDLMPLRLSPCSIAINDIGFSYKRGISILKDVAFEFCPGQIYILRGENGVGKSTLARILSGLLKPSTGQITVNGAAVRPWREPGSIASYHFQNPDLQLFGTSVDQELSLGIDAFCLEDAGRRNAEFLLQFFGLRDYRGDHPLDLPFVLRKRVALAATFVTGRSWVILDEPTLGQDEDSCQALASFLSNAAQCGLGIIVITHSDGFAAKLQGQTVILKDGSLKFKSQGVSFDA